LTAGDVIQDALIYVKDASRVNYSDDQLLLLLNDSQDLLGEALGRTPSTVLEKELEIELEDGVADLPEDFVSVRRVLCGGVYLDASTPGDDKTGTFRIEDGSLRVPGEAVVDFFYWSSPARAETESSVLDFPNSFRGGLRKVLTAAMDGEPGMAETVANAIALSCIPRERRGRASTYVPFYV